MKEFFFGCEELETVDLSNFKAKITSAEDMFYECLKIKKIDLSCFTTTTDSKIDSMFDKIPSSMEKKKSYNKRSKYLKAFDNRYIPGKEKPARLREKEYEGEEGEEA